MKELHLDIHYVTRVEGHGNIVVNVKDGKIEEYRWEVPEAPRFFEAMVRGRRYDEAPHITSRICGICSIGHTLASVQGIEAAIGVRPSEQTLLLRKLALHAETLQSHILHVGYLVVPDLLGVGSVIPLVNTHKEAVLLIVRLHRLANEMSDLICGRTTHPINIGINGWTRLPTVKELQGLRQRLVDAIPDLQTLVSIVQTLQLPAFERETEYLALKHPDEYAFYEGDIASTDGDVTPVSQYKTKVKEFIVPYSTAKRARGNRHSLAVGALARFNNNHAQLSPLAKKVADALSLKAVCCNPFMNNVAQVVECAHAVEDSIRLIDELLARGIKEEDRRVEVQAGSGVGGVEVPRGTLYHEYTVDDKGIITGCNLIIPTGQNHQNIEDDMAAYLPQLLDKSDEEIALKLQMLVRSYDPCISCSTH
jgi:sulfhydrogenase subunit alpha